MSDVEFLDLRYGCDEAKISHGQSVTGMHGQLQLGGETRSGSQSLKRTGLLRLVGELAGVQLDRLGANCLGHANRRVVGTNEEARANSSGSQLRDRTLDSGRVFDDVESALRSDFLAPFRHQGYLIGLDGNCDRHHLVSAGKLQVEIGADRRAKYSDIGILDVAPVLTQVGGNAIRSDLLADEGGLDRVGLVAAPRLTERRDMIDVHIKTLVACSHNRPEYNFLAMKKLMLAVMLAGTAACASAPPSTSVVDSSPGAKTSVGAVDRFFAAVRSQDLQAMSLVWGTSKGPARDNMPRAELEKREVILQCYFSSDTFRVLGESPTSDIRRMVRVELRREGSVRDPIVYTVRGPDGRWYVENLDIAAVKDFCAMAPVAPGV